MSLYKKNLWRYSCNNAPNLKLCQLHIKYNDSHVQNKQLKIWNDWFKMHSVICDLLYFERQNLSSGCTGYDCLYYSRIPLQVWQNSRQVTWVVHSILFRPKHTNVMVRTLYAFLNIIKYWHLDLILQKTGSL